MSDNYTIDEWNNLGKIVIKKDGFTLYYAVEQAKTAQNIFQINLTL